MQYKNIKTNNLNMESQYSMQVFLFHLNVDRCIDPIIAEDVE